MPETLLDPQREDVFSTDLERFLTWEFPKIGGTLFWGPYNKDRTIWVTILGSPIFGNPHMVRVTSLAMRSVICFGSISASLAH